ncbi:uncharacterized protein JN550_008257 [Neoarthrinium moseri]|uniref:uncharacterized protein n=1 Tax=Neoarthrinium moseri TaxID=1658444 RepID=UPI001FDE6D29|nr:uncharacterized protein JN550_008257 [Neoarthrinium moseri]KAI1865500.1 hypothetical protein JN550_008257 [Neoarthrinium moseri]
MCAISGRNCDCKSCVLRLIEHGKYPYDEFWMLLHQSDHQAPYDYRVASSTAAMRRGELLIPNSFTTDENPQQLFKEIQCKFPLFPDFQPYRFVYHQTRRIGPRMPAKMMLIYTAGSCTNNGQPNARGGFGFAFSSPGRENTRGCVRHALESEGPFGHRTAATCNRAELRGLIAALEYRCFYREGWDGLVIATDSGYVKQGATELVLNWVENEWHNAKGDKVANKDLWKYLLRLLRKYAIHGCEIMIWQTTRDQNRLAGELAKAGAQFETPASWRSIRDPKLNDTVRLAASCGPTKPEASFDEILRLFPKPPDTAIRDQAKSKAQSSV